MMSVVMVYTNLMEYLHQHIVTMEMPIIQMDVPQAAQFWQDGHALVVQLLVQTHA